MESEIPKETPPVVVVSQPQPEKKPFRLNRWHVIAVVLVAVIVIQGFLYLSQNSSYNTLNANHKSLTNQYSTLQSEHSTLQDSYGSLQTNYSSLRTNYNSLQANYSSLQTLYDSLQSNYNSLQSNYNSYISNYNNLRNQVNLRTLHYSYTNVKGFITPSDATVSAKVIQITGGWSNPSDWNEFWDDVKKMYDWVVNNIEYRSDGLFPVIPTTPSGDLEYGDEMWQFPSETLDLMQGDCEDIAILLTSMILSYNGEKYWTECIVIEGSMSGHVAVQMPVSGDKLTILDPAGNYYTQTSYGDIENKDISTEINNWLNYWKPDLGSDVHVERVFSNNLDKSFSSTSEYTSWMYSR